MSQTPFPNQPDANEPAAEHESQPKLGLALAPIGPEQREQLGLKGDVKGVLVAEVVPGGPAEAKGIAAGDVILSVDHHPVAKPADVVAAVKKAHEEGKKAVLLYVARNGNERFEAIPLATS